jgi:PAS domain S-box-containing protein
MPISNSVDILRAVIEATPDAIFVKDLEGRYVVVNDAAARFLGRAPAEIIGRNDLELYPEATATRFIEDDRAVIASGEPREFEGIAESQSGSQAYYIVTKGVYRDAEGRTLGVYGISHDITTLRQARESLEQTREALFRSQKMEAVGQLTGGISHDFNNILSVIIGNLDLLRLRLQRIEASDPHILELIDAVFRAALHGKDLISQLLAFAGRRQLDAQPVDVSALVANIVRLIGRTIGPAVEIVTSDDGRAGVAMVDPSALEAAVLNVALNARDAMPEGGTLRIATSRLEVTEPAATGDDPKPGSYALLSIEDTGCGMTPDVAARAFEPFFTTKGAHGGTGLGLSMVYGFAKQSGGTVTLRSTPGRGTTLEIYLPLASQTSESAS